MKDIRRGNVEEVKPQWYREPVVGEHGGCLNCGPRPDRYKMNWRIAVGFGYAAVERDGDVIWMEGNTEYDDLPTLMRFENMARKDRRPRDWRVVLHGPLSGRTYQRHGKNEWNLIEQDQGFAWLPE